MSGLRWRDPVMARDGEPHEPEALWLEAARAHPGEVVFLLGEGFDPRMLLGLERWCATAPTPRVVSIDLVEPQERKGRSVSSLQVRSLVSENLARLNTLTTGPLERVAYPKVNNTKAAGLNLTRSLLKGELLRGAALVVVDISSLPATIYFPMIAGLLQHAETTDPPMELLVLVCDNPEIDNAILHEGFGEPGPILGFGQALGSIREAPKENRIWAPILGEGARTPLERLFQAYEPAEVCPILPFPARRTRRADDLVLEYRDLLFGTMKIDPRDFIYADEANPFDAYRALSALQQRYALALAPLDGATTILSSHGSKLLSLGALLAAFEHELPIVTAAPSGYSLREGADLASLRRYDRLACLWLAGAPYR